MTESEGWTDYDESMVEKCGNSGVSMESRREMWMNIRKELKRSGWKAPKVPRPMLSVRATALQDALDAMDEVWTGWIETKEQARETLKGAVLDLLEKEKLK